MTTRTNTAAIVADVTGIISRTWSAGQSDRGPVAELCRRAMQLDQRLELVQIQAETLQINLDGLKRMTKEPQHEKGEL